MSLRTMLDRRLRNRRSTGGGRRLGDKPNRDDFQDYQAYDVAIVRWLYPDGIPPCEPDCTCMRGRDTLTGPDWREVLREREGTLDG